MQKVPNQVIGSIAAAIAEGVNTDTLISIFLDAHYPGDIPAEPKRKCCVTWLKRANEQSPDPQWLLGRLLGELATHLPREASSRTWDTIDHALSEWGRTFDGQETILESAPKQAETAVDLSPKPIQRPDDTISSVTQMTTEDRRPTAPNRDRVGRVFIVHGHDDGLKNTAARFVQTLGLEAVILHEQSNSTETVFDKLSRISSSVDFAVVLLTADDEGRRRAGDSNLLPRARQNVVLELGLFLGTVGKDRVVVVLDKGVELPSDVLGVIYLQRDRWQFPLIERLRSAGASFSDEAVSRAMAIQ
jgi:Predicted nucleotide-binding protein containing TIR -like domain